MSVNNISQYLDKLNVLYEDNHILVVEKFINVPSQKDITEDIDMTTIISEYLRKKYQKPGNVYVGLIHRLDRRVGGVMVFAKTSKAAKRLSEDIRNHEFEKYYIAKVKGLINRDGNICVQILKDEQKKVAIIDKKGKEAKLDYHVLKHNQDTTELLVRLYHGRYNQIRVSFAYINHPLVNDYKYDKTIKYTTKQLGLWSYKIKCIHPVTKVDLEFVLDPKWV